MGVALNNLRTKSHNNIVCKAQHSPIDNCGNTTGCIDDDSQEMVDNHIDSLLLDSSRHIAIKIPSRKSQEWLYDFRPPYRMKMAFLEFPDAIYTVDDGNEDGNTQDKESVKNQFVKISYQQDIDNDQLQQDVEHFHIRIDIHFLMGDNGGIVRDLCHSYHHRQDRGLIYHMSRSHSSFRDIQFVSQQPESHCLRHDKNHQSNG